MTKSMELTFLLKTSNWSVKKSSAFYRTHSFITTNGPYPEPDKTSTHSHPTSLKFILISFYHLHLDLPSGFFLQVSYQNCVCISLLSRASYMFRLSYPLDLVTLIAFGALSTKDNIKAEAKETGWEGMQCILLVDDSDEWRSVVYAVMNLRIPYNTGSSLAKDLLS
jgi:hypothetical protein